MKTCENKDCLYYHKDLVDAGRLDTEFENTGEEVEVCNWCGHSAIYKKIRDEKTKQLFIKYLEDHPDERFMQAVRNFIVEEGFCYREVPFLALTGSIPRDGEDTFYWECDEMLEEEE